MKHVTVDSLEYVYIHKWINYHYGKASCCQSENCKGKSKRFEWALIKGMAYERDIKNYIQLCASCHRYYDVTETTRLKLSISSSKPRPEKRIKVAQYNIAGELVNTYVGISVASKQANILRTSISNSLTGRYKTAGGYIWKYL